MWCFIQYIFVLVFSFVSEGVNLFGWLFGEIMIYFRLKYFAKFFLVILIQDRVSKIVSIYVRVYEAWQIWVVQCEVIFLLADFVVFFLYLVYFIQQDRFVFFINFVIYGVSWVYKKSGYQQLSDYFFVQQVVEVVRRIFVRFLSRRRFLEVRQVKSVIRRFE